MFAEGYGWRKEIRSERRTVFEQTLVRVEGSPQLRPQNRDSTCGRGAGSPDSMLHW